MGEPGRIPRRAPRQALLGLLSPSRAIAATKPPFPHSRRQGLGRKGGPSLGHPLPGDPHSASLPPVYALEGGSRPPREPAPPTSSSAQTGQDPCSGKRRAALLVPAQALPQPLPPPTETGNRLRGWRGWDSKGQPWASPLIRGQGSQASPTRPYRLILNNPTVTDKTSGTSLARGHSCLVMKIAPV